MSERHGPESPLAVFLAEAWDVLSTVESGLSGLDAPEGAEPLLVAMHRLKGAAALYGFAGLARLAAAGERALERGRGAAPDERHRAAAFLGDLVPVMKLVCGDIDQTGSERLDTVATFTDRYASFCVSAPPMPAGVGPRYGGGVSRGVVSEAAARAEARPVAAPGRGAEGGEPGVRAARLDAARSRAAGSSAWGPPMLARTRREAVTPANTASRTAGVRGIRSARTATMRSSIW